MLVNYTAQGWEIIHQRAHGVLAVQLASHWKASKRPARWLETLLAIAEHDDAQENWQGRNHLNENGTPLHFDMKKYSFVQMTRIADLSQHKSRWIALLISKHLSFLYEPMRGDNQELDAFLDEQQTHQQEWQRALGVKPAEIQYAYDLMQWCDQFSLILCQNQLPTGERALEISQGPDHKVYQVRQRQEGDLLVQPWPFEEDAFEVNVEARLVTQLQFESDEQLMEHIKKAPVTLKTWRLTRSA